MLLKKYSLVFFLQMTMIFFWYFLENTLPTLEKLGFWFQNYFFIQQNYHFGFLGQVFF